MIQRIQTVYLALAVLLLVLCCLLPLAAFEPAGMGVPQVMYSLCLLSAERSAVTYLPATLLGITALAELVIIMAIFGYRNRRQQMKLCTVAIVLPILWMGNFAAYAMMLVPETTFRPRMGAALPVVAMILVVLARRAIKKDDDLVRSADRIR